MVVDLVPGVYNVGSLSLHKLSIENTSSILWEKTEYMLYILTAVTS
jgi:hypothetical protein